MCVYTIPEINWCILHTPIISVSCEQLSDIHVYYMYILTLKKAAV